MNNAVESPWYEDSNKVLQMLVYMAGTYAVTRESMEQIACAAEKPWKHEDVWRDAQAYVSEEGAK